MNLSLPASCQAKCASIKASFQVRVLDRGTPNREIKRRRGNCYCGKDKDKDKERNAAYFPKNSALGEPGGPICPPSFSWTQIGVFGAEVQPSTSAAKLRWPVVSFRTKHAASLIDPQGRKQAGL